MWWESYEKTLGKNSGRDIKDRRHKYNPASIHLPRLKYGRPRLFQTMYADQVKVRFCCCCCCDGGGGDVEY